MPSKEFLELLEQSKAIHEKKSHDYANDANPFQNFDYQVIVMSWFKDDRDKVFSGIIAQKLARLAELSSGKIAKNEAIEDTELDIITYTGLWMAYRRKNKNKRQELVQEMKGKMNEAINTNIHLQIHAPNPDIFNNLDHRCVICNAAFMDMHLYCKHAIDMHSAIYDPKEGSLQFVDVNKTKEVLPSLKFLLGTYELADKDIPF